MSRRKSSLRRGQPSCPRHPRALSYPLPALPQLATTGHAAPGPDWTAGVWGTGQCPVWPPITLLGRWLRPDKERVSLVCSVLLCSFDLSSLVTQLTCTPAAAELLASSSISILRKEHRKADSIQRSLFASEDGHMMKCDPGTAGKGVLRSFRGAGGWGVLPEELSWLGCMHFWDLNVISGALAAILEHLY